jgi:hypothetical protein
MFSERSAFAGNTEDTKQDPLRPFGPLPPEGEDLVLMIFPLWGKYRRSRGRGLYVPLAQNPLPCAPWANENRERDHEP